MLNRYDDIYLGLSVTSTSFIEVSKGMAYAGKTISGSDRRKLLRNKKYFTMCTVPLPFCNNNKILQKCGRKRWFSVLIKRITNYFAKMEIFMRKISENNYVHKIMRSIKL